MPSAKNDPHLLPEQETPPKIHNLVLEASDSSRWFRQNPRFVTSMERVSGRNENRLDERFDYMPGCRTRMDNH